MSQSMLSRDPDDYSYRNINHLILGIVTRVYLSDDPHNAFSLIRNPYDNSGKAVEIRSQGHTCEVLALLHSSDNMYVIPNVVILPRGATGLDDYSEEIPKPCSQTVDGTAFNYNMQGIDPTKLDGDWCIVGYIGGHNKRPVLLSWFPHPANLQDPATSNALGTNVLAQGRRLFRRYRGTKFTVTNKGSIYLDTSEANSLTSGTKKGWKRELREQGGRVQLDIKSSQQLEINFNPPVAVTNIDASVPAPVNSQGYYAGNPPILQQRETTATTVTFDKDNIELLAGKQLHAKAENSELTMQNSGIVAAGSQIDINGDACNFGKNADSYMARGTELIAALTAFATACKASTTDPTLVAAATALETALGLPSVISSICKVK